MSQRLVNEQSCLVVSSFYLVVIGQSNKLSLVSFWSTAAEQIQQAREDCDYQKSSYNFDRFCD